MTVSLSTTWSSAHFYRHPSWSADENQKKFGKCYSEYGHGHDYVLQVTWDCSTEQVTSLQNILTGLQESLDHHHLNFVIPKFKQSIPTTENLLLFCFDKISETLKTTNLPPLKALRLYERPDLWVELETD